MSVEGPKRMALDVQASNDLRIQMQQDSKAGIQKAAQEFESMFLNMMLKSMRDTVPQDGLFDSEQSRFYTTMLDQQMAQDIAKKGGLGFAKMLVEQFTRAQADAASAATGSGTEGTGLSPKAQDLLNSLQQLRNNNLPAVPGNVAVPSASGQQAYQSGAALAIDPVAAGGGGAGNAQSSSNPSDFVGKVWPHALEASRATGIPPQFLVAQAALETGWGRSEMRQADGSLSFNLFGIKAGRTWGGGSVQAETSEFVDGQETRSVASFRAYGSYAEAFRDYANLLRNNPRYGAVIGSQDGTEFARRLQQAGYATDPQYAEKLARIINGPTLRQAMIG